MKSGRLRAGSWTLANLYDHLLGQGMAHRIDFGGYLQSLCMGFRDVADLGQHAIVLTCESTPLMLDLDTSTALGLIVAELITNSYRHAFPGGGEGRIDVSVPAVETVGEGVIVFADNGIGYKMPNDSKRRGLGLVLRLMEQLGGSAVLASDRGTMWTLRFPIL